jgi:LuxR family maltose regulon positive regulatory protein
MPSKPQISAQGAQIASPKHGRPDLIARESFDRPRLLLDLSSATKAIAFRAPVGFGKSVALVQNHIAARAQGRSAWVSLKRKESEASVARSLASQLDLGDDAKINDLTQFADTLWTAFAETDQAVLLCIDDIGGHLDLLSALDDFACKTPAQVKLGFAGETRRGFARLNLQHSVLEHGPDDLRFTSTERRAFFKVTTPTAATANDAGWPAMCRIAAQAKVLGPTLWRLPEAINFLEQEVLGGLDASQIAFLECVAILDPILPEGMDFAFKTTNSGEMATALSMDGLVLSLSEERPGFYKIEPVLQEYLAARFKDHSAKRDAYYLKRAAFWHWRRRDFQYAVSLATRAGDYRWALALSEEVVFDMALRQGEIGALNDWLGKLGEQERLKHPVLGLAYAWSLYFCQQAGEANKVLAQLEADQRKPLGRKTRALSVLVKAIGLATHDDLLESERLCRQWISEFGDDDLVGKGAALTCLTFIMASTHRMDEFKRFFELAHTTNQLARQHYAFAWLYTAQVQALISQGDMRDAYQKLASIEQTSAAEHRLSKFAQQMLDGMAFAPKYELGKMDVDAASIDALVQFAMTFGVSDVAFGIITTAANWLDDNDQSARARENLIAAIRHAQSKGLDRLDLSLRMALAEYELSAIGQDRQQDIPSETEVAFAGPHGRLLKSQLYLLRAIEAATAGKSALGKQNADIALKHARAMGAGKLELRARLWQAACLCETNPETAHKSLVAATEKARQSGLLATHRRTIAAIARLMPRSIFAREQSPTLVAVLPDQSPVSIGGGITALRESGNLSAKQLSVLRFVGMGMSNKQISDQLVITEDTVKWHMRKVFAELKVINRVQAVKEAERRNLI